MLNKAQKVKIVEDLVDRLKRQKIAIFSDFTGISVSKFQALRRLLKKNQAEYKITRKTLFDRALGQAGKSFKTQELQGEIGVTFGYEDESTPAKILFRFGRENETFKLLGGILGNRILSPQEITKLAKLPKKEIILGPDDGYGVVDPKAIMEVEKSRLPKGEIEPGIVLEVHTPKGEKWPVTIVEVKEKTVVVNFNHPLAGKELHFNVEVLEIS